MNKQTDWGLFCLLALTALISNSCPYWRCVEVHEKLVPEAAIVGYLYGVVIALSKLDACRDVIGALLLGSRGAFYSETPCSFRSVEFVVSKKYCI